MLIIALEVKKGGFSTSWAVQPQKVHNSSSSLRDTCQGIAPKICDSVLLYDWCLSWVKTFYATPTNQDPGISVFLLEPLRTVNGQHL